MVKIEDIVFWILIIAVIGIVIWMLLGSPTLENGLLTLTIFIATSEILLWKAVFSIDKRTTMGFMKMKNYMDNNFTRLKNDIEKNNLMINSRFDKIENKLNIITKKLK